MKNAGWVLLAVLIVLVGVVMGYLAIEFWAMMLK